VDGIERRLAEIEAQLAIVTARLAALEGSAPQASADAIAGAQLRPTGFADQLQRRLPTAEIAPEPVAGLLAYAGAVRAPQGELVWDHERTAAELLALDLEPVAQVLATLGHAVRLELMRLLLQGPQTSQQLQEALGLGSSGPLYYHLKELIAAGLVTQPSRNLYQVSHQRIIPFLAVLVAALDVRGG
jgi:DNA-binding transcriptional ArsR family regulator